MNGERSEADDLFDQRIFLAFAGAFRYKEDIPNPAVVNVPPINDRSEAVWIAIKEINFYE